MEKPKYIRTCPKCNEEMEYKSHNTCQKAEKKCGICRSCALDLRPTTKRFYITDNEKFIVEYNRGLSDRKLCEIFKCNRQLVQKRRKSLNLKPNFEKFVTEIIDENSNRCSLCKEVKSLKEFSFVDKKGHRSTYCSTCKKQRNKDRVNNCIEKFLISKWHQLKQKARRTGHEFTLSTKDILEIYKTQNGLCFYSDQVLVCKQGQGRSPNSLSVDRVDNSKGYAIENVVFCTNRINELKRDMSMDELKQFTPEWYKRIMKKFDFDMVR